MCPIFFSEFNQIRNISADFNETPAIKFHEDPFRWIRVVPWGRMERRTDSHDRANYCFLHVWKCA